MAVLGRPKADRVFHRVYPGRKAFPALVTCLPMIEYNDKFTNMADRLPYILPFSGIKIESAITTLASDPGFVCVGSCGAGGDDGRYSIIASFPKHTFQMSGGFITIDGHTAIDTPLDAFAGFFKGIDDLAYDSYLPFSGGAIGYIGFEGARALRGFAPAKGFSRLPQCNFGIYLTAAVFDHTEGTSFIVSNGASIDSVRKESKKLLNRLTHAPVWTSRDEVQTDINRDLKNMRLIPDDENFRNLANSAFSWLRSEKIDRIHLTRHVEIPCPYITPTDFFLMYEGRHPTRAFFTYEGTSSVLESESLLLHIEGDSVKSHIGTARRMRGASDHGREILRICTAESIARNDRGTKSFFSGIKRQEMDPLDGLIGLIPSEGLTGSPRHLAISYLDEYEPSHRRFYGGAFGLIQNGCIEFHMIESATSSADGATASIFGADFTQDMSPKDFLEKFNSTLNSVY